MVDISEFMKSLKPFYEPYFNIKAPRESLRIKVGIFPRVYNFIKDLNYLDRPKLYGSFDLSRNWVRISSDVNTSYFVGTAHYLLFCRVAELKSEFLVILHH